MEDSLQKYLLNHKWLANSKPNNSSNICVNLTPKKSRAIFSIIRTGASNWFRGGIFSPGSQAICGVFSPRTIPEPPKWAEPKKCGSFYRFLLVPRGVRPYGEDYRDYGPETLYTTHPEVEESDETGSNLVASSVRAQ